MKKILVSVTSAVCMLGAVAAQAAPIGCYGAWDSGTPLTDPPTSYYMYSVKREDSLSGSKENRDFGTPPQTVYSAFGRSSNPIGTQVTPLHGVILEAKDTGVIMYLSNYTVDYSCVPLDDTDVSTLPSGWQCDSALKHATSGTIQQILQLQRVDNPSSTEACSAYVVLP